MSSTRKGYAEAMRRRKNASTTPETPQASKLRPALEKVAKKVYTTANPTVNKVKSAVVSGLTSYNNATNSLANKLRPYLEKLPKSSTPPKVRRLRKRMDK